MGTVIIVSSNNMNVYFVSLIFLQAGITLSGSCCEEKTVGGVNYKNIGEKNTSEHGCTSGCIYERMDDTPRKVYCFKQGDLPSKCRSRIMNCPRTVDEFLSYIDIDAVEFIFKTAEVRNDPNFWNLNQDSMNALNDIDERAKKIRKCILNFSK